LVSVGSISVILPVKRGASQLEESRDQAGHPRLDGQLVVTTTTHTQHPGLPVSIIRRHLWLQLTGCSRCHSRPNDDSSTRGVVLKKKWGTPETRLRQRFLNSLGLHTCCTEIILHCVSVSNQLQQWTNFCTNFSPKKWGTRPPVEKKWGDAAPSPASSPHYTPV